MSKSTGVAVGITNISCWTFNKTYVQYAVQCTSPPASTHCCSTTENGFSRKAMSNLVYLRSNLVYIRSNLVYMRSNLIYLL